MELWLFMVLCKHYDSFSCLLLCLFFSWFLSKLFKAEILNPEFCVLWTLREQVSSQTFLLYFRFSTAVQTEVSRNYVTAWQHVVSGSYNLFYCLSFSNTRFFSSLWYVTWILYVGLPSHHSKRESRLHAANARFIWRTKYTTPPFLCTFASVDKALHSPLTQRKWGLLRAHMIVGG